MSAASACIDQAQKLIRRRGSVERLLPVAGHTKPALSGGGDDVTLVDVSDLRGITEYDPAELTVTAFAGTPVVEVAEALAEHEQYLPFEPPLADAGATLGGAVASATSGSNAFRHGGVRDFVIGVRLIDGIGRLVSGGGKVVKNSAGFDLPKLMVGSRGRLGVITQLSFKVFPRPRATVTHRYNLGDLNSVLTTIARLCRGPLTCDAIDVEPGGSLVVRLGGDPEVLVGRSRRLKAEIYASAAVLDGDEVLADGDDRAYWEGISAFSWMSREDIVVRVPVPSGKVPCLDAAIGVDTLARYSLAANVAWISWPCARSLRELSDALAGLGLTGIALTGTPVRDLLGARPDGAFAERVRSALDPFNRFVTD